MSIRTSVADWFLPSRTGTVERIRDSMLVSVTRCRIRAMVSKVKQSTRLTVDFGGNAWDAPVPSARRTPMYADANATVSTALITPYSRAYWVSFWSVCFSMSRLTDFKKQNVIKGIINDKRNRPKRYSDGNESIHSRCSGIAGYTTMPVTTRTNDEAWAR